MTIINGNTSIRFGRVDGYQAPGWPDASAPKRYHFDLRLGDADVVVVHAHHDPRAVDSSKDASASVMPPGSTATSPDNLFRTRLVQARLRRLLKSRAAATAFADMYIGKHADF
jgi:hypothetical protein